MLLYGKDELAPQQPHSPACNYDSADKHAKAIEPVAKLIAGGVPLGYPKNYGSKQGKKQRRAKVSQCQRGHYDFFPIAM